ncbi:MAG: hypothetical protein AAB209_04850 [Bacteroidota bacterium]|jgi:hypothetical protein
MKKTRSTKRESLLDDDLLPEYNIDYGKAKPNRFAKYFTRDRIMVTLDPDVGKVFTNTRHVNDVLRALIKTMPKRTARAA